MVPATLYQRIKRALDMDLSDTHLDAELGERAEEAYLELWDFLIATLGDEGPWERTNLTTVAGQEYIDTNVAFGIWRTLRLEFKGDGSSWHPLSRLNLGADPLEATARSWTSAHGIRYYARRSFRATHSEREGAGRMHSWRFYFDPIPAAVHTLRLYYIPTPPITIDVTPSAPEDGIYTSFPDEYPEFVVATVCAGIRVKEEADPTEFERQRDRVKAIIEAYCKPVQMNQPQFVADHRRLQTGDFDPYDFQRR